MKTIVDLETDLVKPYIDAEDEKFAANIAPVETSPATGAHAVGSQIIYNGVLYDVTAAIAATDALVVGTNIAAADDVVTQITSVETGLENEVVTRATNGAHNLFETSFETIKSLNTEGTWNNRTFTPTSAPTLQITVNEDLSITANTVGGATASSYSFILASNTNMSKYSGMRLSGNSQPYADAVLAFTMVSSPYTAYATDYSGRSAIIDTVPSNTNCWVFIAFKVSKTFNNVKFYPMIRSAVDSNSEFTPYAKTNRELTENVIPTIFDASNLTSANARISLENQSARQIQKIGKLVIVERLVIIISAGEQIAFNVGSLVSGLPKAELDNVNLVGIGNIYADYKCVGFKVNQLGQLTPSTFNNIPVNATHETAYCICGCYVADE